MALFRCASGGGGGGQITVTYDSDFYGQTITCTRGQKVYSKVASSSGSVVFVVNEEGDWLIECTIGQDTYSTTASIEFTTSTELVSIPDGTTVLPTDDVETWLACAGIQDKAYTTLSQVLADSETFNALLGDSNACAYMARSTTWSTDICADQYAMSMIGLYDVCCDALLGNATWASAIASSSYADYIFTGARKIIPKMTSGTTSGCTVSATSTYDSSYAAYKAFDRDTSTRWLAPQNTPSASLNITLASSKVIKGFYFKPSGYYWSTYSLKAYVNNEWVELCNGTNDRTALEFYIPLGDNEYDTDVYKIDFTQYDNFIGVEEIQFYGHADTSEYIHGTNNESAYYLDGATQTPIVDPSTLSAGTYTFGSTVAKNPSDLTADYTKTIRITPNTKEIVLRPDGALYWWGYMSAGCEEVSSANGWTTTPTSVSPTFDSYHIRTATSSSTLSGIGSKYAMSAHTYHIIASGVTVVSGTYSILAGRITKNWSSGYTTYIQTNSQSLTKYDLTITDNSYYSYYASEGGRSSDLNALWYE